jgi:DNA-binding NarL/FixJ family response regulator
MARAYHRDLRERAIGLLRRGLSKEEVAGQLQISWTTTKHQTAKMSRLPKTSPGFPVGCRLSPPCGG